MKKLYRNIILATVMGVLCASPAFADDRGDDHRGRDNNAAKTEVDQESEDNKVVNINHLNDAFIGDSALKNASGNIGVNVGVGTQNMQTNTAAIMEADEAEGHHRGRHDRDDKTLGAEVEVDQDSDDNKVINKGNVNSANVAADALRNATGNIGVNLATGDQNVQSNSMSAVTGVAKLGSASVEVDQKMDDNFTLNKGLMEEQFTTVRVSLDVNVQQEGAANARGGYIGGYAGEFGGGFIGGYEGTTAGYSDQVGNVYPDIWEGDSHTGGPQIGHFDLDTDTQGGSDRNSDGGALLFKEDGTESGVMGGIIGGREHGFEAGLTGGTVTDMDLAGTATGELITSAGWIITPTENRASIGDNALRGAKGNIGVNVASGSQNMQSNSLALASVCGSCDGGTSSNGNGVELAPPTTER